MEKRRENSSVRAGRVPEIGRYRERRRAREKRTDRDRQRQTKMKEETEKKGTTVATERVKGQSAVRDGIKSGKHRR